MSPAPAPGPVREIPPTGPIVAFYGDDFTGSSAVMEVMSFAGLPTVMFVEPPDAERLAAFSDFRCIGIAGTARAETPDWMDANLPAAYAALERLGAPVNHYKVCSTFDSSPRLGSIGRAIDLAIPVLAPRCVPLVTGAPAIGRYQAFGNLFAVHDGTVHRLDRHPSMRRHPSTPMGEADLGRHLAAQSRHRIGLVDLVALKSGRGAERLEAEIADGARVLSLDLLDDETLVAVGALLWREASLGRVFAVGSQGVEYALIAYWRQMGLLPPPAAPPRAAAADRIAVVSGSLSPTTAAQIANAIGDGFDLVAVDPSRLADEAGWAVHLEMLVETGLSVLRNGRSPIVASARGPDDPAVAKFAAIVEAAGAAEGTLQRRLSKGLGQVLARLFREGGVSRGVVCGGDTSSFATRALCVDALSAATPIAPGAPLCRTYGAGGSVGAFELALKGGQMGQHDYLSRVRAGG